MNTREEEDTGIFCAVELDSVFWYSFYLFISDYKANYLPISCSRSASVAPSHDCVTSAIPIGSLHQNRKRKTGDRAAARLAT